MTSNAQRLPRARAHTVRCAEKDDVGLQLLDGRADAHRRRVQLPRLPRLDRVVRGEAARVQRYVAVRQHKHAHDFRASGLRVQACQQQRRRQLQQPQPRQALGHLSALRNARTRRFLLKSRER